MSSSSSVRVWAAVVVVLCSAGCEKKVELEAAPVARLAPSAAAAKGAPDVDAAVALAKVEIPEVRIRPDGTTTVRVVWITPKDTAVNDEAPFRVRWNRSEGLDEAPADVKSTGSTVKDGFRVKVRPTTGAPNATLDGEIDIVVCDSATHSVCVPVKRKVQLGFVAAKGAAEEATVSIPLPAAK